MWSIIYLCLNTAGLWRWFMLKPLRISLSMAEEWCNTTANRSRGDKIFASLIPASTQNLWPSLPKLHRSRSRKSGAGGQRLCWQARLSVTFPLRASTARTNSLRSSGVITALKSDEGVVVVVEGLATCPPGSCRSSCLQLQAFHVPDTFCPMISCYPQHHSSTACTTHTRSCLHSGQNGSQVSQPCTLRYVNQFNGMCPVQHLNRAFKVVPYSCQGYHPNQFLIIHWGAMRRMNWVKSSTVPQELKDFSNLFCHPLL